MSKTTIHVVAGGWCQSSADIGCKTSPPVIVTDHTCPPVDLSCSGIGVTQQYHLTRAQEIVDEQLRGGANVMLPFFSADGQILMDGKPIAVRGVNWFGFEGAQGMVDGLWIQPMAWYVNFLGLQGFNALRVPLAMDNLHRNHKINRDTCSRDPYLVELASHGGTHLDAIERCPTEAQPAQKRPALAAFLLSLSHSAHIREPRRSGTLT
jgi:hypothetical protein